MITAGPARMENTSPSIAGYPVHPYADTFPLVEGAEFAALVESIRANGLRYPVVIHRGCVIDGRNRLRACAEAGVEPRFEEFTGESAVAFIADSNLRRRQMTPSQGAIYAAEVLPALEAEARQRRVESGRLFGEAHPKSEVCQSFDTPLSEGRASDKAAKLFQTNRQYVSDAKALLLHGPDLAEEVRAGRLSISAAREALDDRKEEAAEIQAVEQTLRWVLEREPTDREVDEAREECRESKRVPTMRKPDLGGGVSHPARYSEGLIPVFAEMLKGYQRVLDPFAGTGRIHELQEHGFSTIGVEIEPEWAHLHPDTLCGNALSVPFPDAAFDAICTSPCYGNRLADHHNASDPHLRRSYTHDLGRVLSPGNAGSLQWGPEYRDFHERAWREALRLLRPGGRFVLSIKDHIRDFRLQLVSHWHVGCLCSLGLELDAERSVSVTTPGLRQGTNAELRGEELVLVFDAVERSHP